MNERHRDYVRGGTNNTGNYLLEIARQTGILRVLLERDISPPTPLTLTDRRSH